MDNQRRPVLLIPAYCPTVGLLDLVSNLLDPQQFQALVIVDDGSGQQFSHLFQQLQSHPGVHLLNHIQNKGKGAALKTGMAFILATFPQCSGVVTCDADGQHLPEDILQVAQVLLRQTECLTLGVRQFDNSTPWRSRIGNHITRKALLLLTRIPLQDTQTGLRAIPLALIQPLLALKSDGYEFEMEMILVASRQHISIQQTPIQSVYMDGNKSSHFNPLIDSLLIYFTLFRYTLSSLFATLLDNLVFALVYISWPNLLGSHICGRILATTSNFIINRQLVFHSRRNIYSSLFSYLALTIFSTTMSYLLINYLQGEWQINVFLAKIMVETLFFFFNFTVQNHVVFPR